MSYYELNHSASTMFQTYNLMRLTNVCLQCYQCKGNINFINMEYEFLKTFEEKHFHSLSHSSMTKDKLQT